MFDSWTCLRVSTSPRVQLYLSASDLTVPKSQTTYVEIPV